MIKSAELAYARVQAPDLDLAERFFHDFGLKTRHREDGRLYLRGTGSEHHLLVVERGERRFLALGFAVERAEDLERAALLPGASLIEQTGEPGGGARVILHDPDGNRVEIVQGAARTPREPTDLQYFNCASDPARRRNAIVRPPAGPARVLRIGHAVMRSPDVARLSDWYRATLGMIASDNVRLSESELLMSFLRLDAGERPVDHHVFQALKGPPRHLHHISFEVQDIDDLFVGHQALQAAGRKHVWGIGRHRQGSQIFDYWLDPFGVMYEHWTDTDMFDASVPTVEIAVEEMGPPTPWGPPMPEAFLQQATA